VTSTTTASTVPSRATDASSGRRVDVTTLRVRLDDSKVDVPRVLDVRTPAEFETAHIPGSHNVPLDLLREHRTELTRHLDDDVVLVCRSGARATQAERALGEAGAPGLSVLEGHRSTAVGRPGSSSGRSASPPEPSWPPASSAAPSRHA
jgi:rhodanese-related sulfurtransferase